MSKAREAIDRVYRDVFLSKEYFAERVLLIRNANRAENITALTAAIVLARANESYITVSISDPEEELITDDGSATREEEIFVQCCRDEAATNSKGVALGGIAQPNLHDAILREEAADPWQIPYYYKHEMRDSTPVLWRLVFRRYMQGVQGVGG